MKALLFVLLLAMGADLCAQEIIAQEHWPDGTLRATRYSEGDRIHFITYHENGRVKEQGGFRNGRREGLWKQYSDTGAIVAKAEFRNGERQGLWEFRDGADRPLGRLVYNDGTLLHGESYDEGGALVAQREY